MRGGRVSKPWSNMSDRRPCIPHCVPQAHIHGQGCTWSAVPVVLIPKCAPSQKHLCKKTRNCKKYTAGFANFWRIYSANLYRDIRGGFRAALRPSLACLVGWAAGSTQTRRSFALNNHSIYAYGLYMAGFAKNQRIQPYTTHRHKCCGYLRRILRAAPQRLCWQPSSTRYTNPSPLFNQRCILLVWYG
jgi:hypothetical protein